MKPVFWVVLLSLAVAGRSASQGLFSVGADGGISVSSFPKPADGYYNTGFGGGVHADLNVASILTLRLSGDYYTFPSDKAKLKKLYIVTDQNGIPTDNFSVAGGTYSILGITLSSVWKIPTGSAVTPYGIIGGGAHIGNLTDVTVSSGGQTLLTDKGGSSDTRFGLTFGAGTSIRLGSVVALIFEARYVLVFTPDTRTAHIPLTLGITF